MKFTIVFVKSCFCIVFFVSVFVSWFLEHPLFAAEPDLDNQNTIVSLMDLPPWRSCFASDLNFSIGLEMAAMPAETVNRKVSDKLGTEPLPKSFALPELGVSTTIDRWYISAWGSYMAVRTKDQPAIEQVGYGGQLAPKWQNDFLGEISLPLALYSRKGSVKGALVDPIFESRLQHETHIQQLSFQNRFLNKWGQKTWWGVGAFTKQTITALKLRDESTQKIRSNYNLNMSGPDKMGWQLGAGSDFDNKLSMTLSFLTVPGRFYLPQLGMRQLF